jgi:hypothetical protein
MDRCRSPIGKVRKKLRRLGKPFKFRLLLPLAEGHFEGNAWRLMWMLLKWGNLAEIALSWGKCTGKERVSSIRSVRGFRKRRSKQRRVIM